MGRGQREPSKLEPSQGFTKQQLLDSSGLSSKTFDMIRKAARVRGPSHGGLNWVFSAEDVATMVHRAESGRFTERGGPAGVAWRKLLIDGVGPEKSDDAE